MDCLRLIEKILLGRRMPQCSFNDMPNVDDDDDARENNVMTMVTVERKLPWTSYN